MKPFKLFFGCFIILVQVMGAQDLNTDSLLNIIHNKSTPDSIRCKLYYQLGKHLYSSQPEKALDYSNQAITIASKIGNQKVESEAISIIGVIYKNNGDYTGALKQQIKALKIKESIHDSLGLAISNNDIGVIYKNMKQFKLAIQYYKKSNLLCRKIDYLKGIIMTYNNIGTIHSELKNSDSTKFYYSKALAMAEKSNNKQAIATCLSNLGEYYASQNDQKEALHCFEKCLVLDTENNDAYGMMLSNINISGVCIDSKNYSDAKKYLTTAEKLAIEINAKPILKDIYSSTSFMYKQLGDFPNAYLYLSKYNQINDSIMNSETTGQIAEMQTKYETEKKEKENQLLNSQNQLSSETIKQQTTVSYFIISCLLLALGLAFFIFKGLKTQRKANKIISLQKLEVERQKHIVEEHQKETLDSIHYAKRIQTALLANQEFINSHLPQNFILFKPKDIVSGDFYWATEHNNKFYLAVCDCTGHGVPGAFMSLLNMGFLSEAIKEKNIAEPGEIFNYVRKRLITSISSDGQQDGMDGILLCIDKTTKEITYSAANNEPILISNNQILELPKDKMPVGKGEKTDSFKTHVVKANTGDTLYLYTDGYADQFGGTKGKKFKYKALNELLFSIQEESMENQKEVLNTTIENWKGNLEQVDDVLIVGIKI